MLNLFKALVVVALLGVPLLVVTQLPKLFEIAGSVPATSSPQVAAQATPGFRLSDPSPTSRTRFGSLDETPPPTLAPPQPAPAVASPSPGPTSTGERIVIGNTGGVGAVLRADPVTGRPVGALREQQVLDVLERRAVAGSGEWLRVRTADGVEGWVTGRVALPAPTATR